MNLEHEKVTADLPEITQVQKLKDYFNDLPEELQLKIFSHFSPVELSRNIAPVCKKWWNVSKDASLWKDLSFTIPTEKSITSYCEVLLRCDLLNSLKIKSAVPLDLIIVCFLELRPYHLKELDLAFCKGLNVQTIAIIVSNCPQIESLNLEGGQDVDYNCVCHIATLKNLRSLNLSRCHFIDDLCIKTIATNCQKLELLNIDNNNKITDDAVCELAIRRRDSLRHLFLDGEELTDQSALAISNCPKLSTLCFSCGQLFTDETLQALAFLQRLTWLKLRECPQLTPAALESFFANPNLSSIEVLELENVLINDRGLQRLAKTCRKLRVISLPLCYDITDEGVKTIVDTCTSLFWLDLTFLYLVTGDALTDIPNRLPNLRYLSLAMCEIDGTSIMELALKMPTLKIHPPSAEYHEYHNSHTDSEIETEVFHLVNKDLNVSWTKMPEGFCGRLRMFPDTRLDKS